MIVDAHAHLSPTDYGEMEIYINLLKEEGIERGVVVPGGMMDVRKLTDYITGKAKPDSLIPNNDYVEQCCRAEPSLTGFFCVDPHDPGGPEKLEQSFRQHSRGLKLSPMTHQFSLAAKSVETLADLCGQFGYPVYTHVLFTPGASTARLAALARKFPKTNFILGHMGFGPADREALEACVQLHNLFLETSCGNFLFIAEAVRQAGADKIIFGSEFPLSHPSAELQKVMLLRISDREREKIVGGNIMALIGLI